MGTILAYTGALDAIPAGWFLCDGSNGTPDLRDRFLEGNGTYSVNTTIAAGIPNIRGKLQFYHAGVDMHTGVFDQETYPQKLGGWDGDYIYGYLILDFNAHAYSPIYKDDITTVQPESYIVYYIIRLK